MSKRDTKKGNTFSPNPADKNIALQKSSEALLGDAEPWASWETKLVTWSIGIAIVGLIVLGILINNYILS